MKRISCIVPYNRRYMKLEIPSVSYYDIIVPTIERSNAFFHQLPHAIDLLIILSNSYSLSISEVNSSENQLVVYGKIATLSFRIFMYIDYTKKQK